MPSCAEFVEDVCRGETRPVSAARTSTRTPRVRSSLMRASSLETVKMTTSFWTPRTILQSRGMRRAESRTTRRSGRRRRRPLRSVSMGSSARTVSTPVSAASACQRSGCTAARACFAGDPVGLTRGVMAGRWCDAAIERHGDFHQDEGALVLDPAGEAFVDAAGFCFADTEFGLKACCTQAFHAVAGDGGIGIAGGGDDAGEAGGDECLGAGAGAAGVIAGLEGDVGGAAFEAVSLPREACCLASLRATISAWSRRSYSCQPSPTTWPARSRMTQPTAGLGEVTPMPRRASSRARCIQ